MLTRKLPYPIVIVFLTSLAFGSQIFVNINTAKLPITPAVMDNLLSIIDNTIISLNGSYNIPIKKIIRGAFHDCTKGCDAAIGLNDTNNRGLENFVGNLSAAYRNSSNSSYLRAYLSQSDFWVLTQQRAIARAGLNISSAGVPCSNSTPIFNYGRIDNPNLVANNSIDFIEGPFPQGISNWTTILSTVSQAYPSITEAQLVTLIGLHGAGGASQNNTGFQGGWVNGSGNLVNNLFYVAMLGVGFPGAVLSQNTSNTVVNPASSGIAQYYSPPPTFNQVQWMKNASSNTTTAKLMLNSDMAIYYNFTVNGTGWLTNPRNLYYPQAYNSTLFNGGLTLIGNQYLPLSRNAALAFQYAQSNATYFAALIPAFLKMVSNLNEFTPPQNIKNFYPQIAKSVDGENCCSGDIFFWGCGQNYPPCSNP